MEVAHIAPCSCESGAACALRQCVLSPDVDALPHLLQLSKSEREVKALRLKLKQATAKLEKAQALGVKLQELGAGLVADAQAPAFE